ncbi:protein kinase [Nostoc sp. CHAB 5784]|uniref:protein kinase domain-containing protein n=1 Tax=Nostoc mirabile TaxID=2907820 RepID=UPI001E367FEE|nr:protein kinase [Nostoc mirabile]MCC5663053.1 protein kinase [Nostoc mirabile CHAB5784]
MSQQNSDPSYSFKTEDDNSLTFYFTLDEQNQPIKLGDGTFGVVFAVYSNRQNKFAVKLLYEHSDTDIVKSRFQNELESTQRITEVKKDTKLFGVIETIGWTKSFRSSEIYKTLKDFFEPFRISDYALVTEKYDSTLKDLLEERVPVDADKQVVKEGMYELTGYDILRKMNFEDRIADILPYLVDIARGLVTLHQAHLLHLDLKPANIFIKKEDSEVKAVIGDLGFLLPGQKPVPGALPIANPQLPLGTRHYRSPEQKDYFDICDVEIKVDNNNVELITYDPKLRDTIIEDTDFVLFSKNSQNTYPIKSINSNDTSENFRTSITLHPEARENLKSDKKTQIILYKRQDERTDLFGFGAIVFDLLTCGESPERFYENIRVIYDKKEKTVDEIMEDYRMVYEFKSSEPSLIQVFEPFKLSKNSTIYAPEEIVEIILKCILYKTKNTFYSLSRCGDTNGNKPVKLVLNSLIELYERKHFGFKRLNNHLCNRIWKNGNNSPTPSFLETLKELQSLDKDNLPARFVKGLWYLDQISDLVSRSLNASPFSFSELHPTNLAVVERNGEPNALNIRFHVYETQESYEKDLRGDFVYTRITRDIGNPFVPNYLAFLRRKIILKKLNAHENYTYKCIYQFFDSSLHRDNIKKGDFIILKSKNNIKNLLLQVEDVEGDNLTLKYGNFDEDNDNKVLKYPHYEDNTEISNTEDISQECIYYKNIDPYVYYLNMIGIYIYHIFFVGIGNNTYNKPIITDIVNNIININNSIKINILEQYNNHSSHFMFSIKKQSKDEKKFQQLGEILNLLASMYLKLTIYESEDSYYRSLENERRYGINLLLHDLDNLKGKITNFINDDNTKPVTLRSYPDETFINEISKLSTLIGDSEQKKVDLQFDRLTSLLVQVHSGGVKLRLDQMLLMHGINI